MGCERFPFAPQEITRWVNGKDGGWLLEPTFQRAVKVAAGNDRLTSDGGAILLREADHRLGLVESLAARLADPRRQDRIRYTLLELLRFRLYALGLGYSAQDDLDLFLGETG